MSSSDKIKSTSFLSALVAFVAVGAFIILLIAGNKIQVSEEREYKNYYVVEEPSCVEEDDENSPIGVKNVFTFYLGEIAEEDTNLAFYTVHQYVEVWLDGEKVYSLKPAQDNNICKTVGSNWVMIPLYREDAGKEINVEITPVYESFRNREVEFLVGSELAIYKDRLSKDLLQIILSIMAIFVGVIFVCAAVYSQLRSKQGIDMVSLGLFSVMMGIWRLSDIRFTPFMFPNHSVLLFNLSILMLMIGMIPLIKWIEKYINDKFKKVMDVYCIISAVCCIFQLFCQITGIADLRENLLLTHIMVAVGMVLGIWGAIFEKIKNPVNTSSNVGSKLSYICAVGVIADGIAFYVKGNSSGLLFSLLSFVLYIVITGVETFFIYSEQQLQLAEKERQLAEKDRKLTERRISSMMSQIRSHFIFNVLTTISGYCKIDPKKADEALIKFSRYLRKNIWMIEEEGLIDFSVELEHLEDYIALEQIRFADRIQFEKEIETSSFQLPPLTIQPIVENAIKHGLIKPGKSGTIWLHSKMNTDCVEITVTDNGIGFVPEAYEKEKSVGIRNVRYRLENMVGGSLAIESTLGKGTKVTIRIPTGEAET